MKKIIAVLFLALLFVISVSAYDDYALSKDSYSRVIASSADVFSAEKGGKWGIADYSGKVVVPFDYDKAGAPDKNGNVVLYKGNEAYIFSKTGKKIYSCKDVFAVEYTDGTVLTMKMTGYNDNFVMTYIAEYFTVDGKTIAEFENVLTATAFSEGYAMVTKTDGTVIIDKNNNVIYTDSTMLVPTGVVSDGKIYVVCPATEASDDCGYMIDIKAKTKTLITGGYTELGYETNFASTPAPIDGYFGHVFQVNADGQPVVSLDGYEIVARSNPVTTRSERVVFKNGKVVGKGFDAIYYTKGSDYFVCDGEGIFYYMDKNGKVASTDYEPLAPFSNGVSPAINPDGEVYLLNSSLERVSGEIKEAYSATAFEKVLFIDTDNGIHTVYKSSTPNKTDDAKPVEKVTPSISNFKKTNVYSVGLFSDVKAGDWFNSNVALAYETGLMKGSSATTFAPTETLTVAQVITMAARLHSIYNTGKAEFVQGSVWYQVYYDYCIKNGIIGSGEYASPNAGASRKMFVNVISKAIPNSEFEAINTISKIPDVEKNGNDSIYRFYEAGIITGSTIGGVEHSFAPDSTIQRSETAAIITRIIDKTLRKKGNF